MAPQNYVYSIQVFTRSIICPPSATVPNPIALFKDPTLMIANGNKNGLLLNYFHHVLVCIICVCQM
jgi:hypothetical protein